MKRLNLFAYTLLSPDNLESTYNYRIYQYPLWVRAALFIGLIFLPYIALIILAGVQG